jgi:PUB domain
LLARFPNAYSYGVRGIPFLVILDTVSGQVVIPGSQSRNEVVQACRGGDLSIEAMCATWLERVPPETIEIISMLELSCKDTDEKRTDNDDATNPYLKRKEGDSVAPLEAGPWNGKAKSTSAAPHHDPQKSIEQALARVTECCGSSSPNAVTTILSTALKYLQPVIKEPWTPKFRTFRLSNKVADRITRIEGGLGLLQALGFEVFGTGYDFMATIPLLVDVEAMQSEIRRLLNDPGQNT